MSPDDETDETHATKSSHADMNDSDGGGQGALDSGNGAVSQIDPDHRLYGAERITLQPSGGPTQGLMSLRELRLLEHAAKFDRAHRNALYALLDSRIEQFTESEWPIIQDMYPEYANRVQEVVCQGNP